MKAKKVVRLAENINKLLKDGRIGHLSTVAPTGRISIVPIGYHFDGMDIYFGTPKGSAKLKFMQKNPNVSFTIDNGLVMREALGVLIQGRAEIYDTKDIFRKLKMTLPAIAGFSKKYPDVFTFYTKDMKKLPEDRKLYKYHLIRIVTEKLLYWDGYNWGRMITKPEDYEPFFDINEKQDPNVVARTLKRFLSALQTTEIDNKEEGMRITQAISLEEPDIVDPDEMISSLLDMAMKDGKVTKNEMDLLITVRNNYHFYQDALKDALSDGVITKDEYTILNTIKKSVYQSAINTAMKDGIISEDEQVMLDTLKSILKIA